MYHQSDTALYRLDSAVRLRERAEVAWRYAIRDALAIGVTVEDVAIRAKTTIEHVLTIADESSTDHLPLSRRNAFQS